MIWSCSICDMFFAYNCLKICSFKELRSLHDDMHLCFETFLATFPIRVVLLGFVNIR